MSDDEAVNRRLRAVERSLTDGNHEVDGLRAAGDAVERIESLESQLTDAEDRIAELEAVTQALRGYVGNVRSVNEDVEQRVDAALAAVERLEARIDEDAREGPRSDRSSVRTPEPDQSRSGMSTGRDWNGEHEPPAERSDEGILTRVRDVL